jgi:hypothetical protein
VWLHDFLPYYEARLGQVFLSRLDLWAPGLLPAERRDVLERLDFEGRAFARARRLVPFLGTQLESRVVALRGGLGGFEAGEWRTGVTPLHARRRLREMTATAGELPSSLQVRHLSAILEACERSGTEVILLSTPVSEALRRMLPSDASEAYRALMDRLMASHRFRRWDDAALPLPDGHFRDPDHLSVAGARAYTRALLARLEAEGLL